MDEATIKHYREAGRIAKRCIAYGVEHIKVGGSMKKVLRDIERIIEGEGAIPAFPPQISVDECAAHFYPGKEDVVFEEDMVLKLDVGVGVNGYIADTAKTIDLSGEHGALVDAAEEALREALSIVKPGTRIGEIGAKIQEVITDHGFTPVRNLTGHGVDRFDAHVAPTIPNIDNGNPNTLEEGMVIAVEPFATYGAGEVYESGTATVFEKKANRKVRNPVARQLLKDIEEFKGLPFASSWLAEKHGWPRTRYGLQFLVKNNVVANYPPLVDREKQMVTQAEHTVLVLDEPIIITK